MLADRMNLRFPSAIRRDPAVDAWLARVPAPLDGLARPWFLALRACGDDVRELLHDGRPTACVGDAPFAYVNAFSAHVNVGFFHGATLADPRRILEGTGRYMRHVKLRPDSPIDADALHALVAAAYAHVRAHAHPATSPAARRPASPTKRSAPRR